MAKAAGTGNSRSVTRVVLGVVVLAAAGTFVFLQMQKRRLIEAENRAIALQNEEQYEQAIAAYEVLLPRLRGEADQRIRRSLATCYANLADAPGLPFDDAMALYRKAYSYSPEAVTNPAILRRLTGDE